MQTGLMQVSPSNITFLALGILAPPCLSIGVVMLAHDRLAERLERLANVDDLTGALSRRAFLAASDALLKASLRTRSPVTMAIIDIDSFKAVNDTHGHAAGDQVLQAFRGVRRAQSAGRRRVRPAGRRGVRRAVPGDHRRRQPSR